MKIRISIIILLLFTMACMPNKNNDSSKMILKASNNMYVVLNTDLTLIANQPDASKAEIFEEICSEKGTAALKTSKGMFVSADRDRDNWLIANRTIAAEWEQFEIIKDDDENVTLKSSTGKFVTADQNIGGLLIANRDQVGTWEKFTLEKK